MGVEMPTLHIEIFGEDTDYIYNIFHTYIHAYIYIHTYIRNRPGCTGAVGDPDLLIEAERCV